MAHRPRFIPPGSLVEVTVRVLMSFFHLPRSDDFRRMVIGTLEYARRKYGVRIHAGVTLSSHYHLILSVDDAKELANFMNLVNSKIAREAGKLFRWSEKFWGGRYSAVLISEEPQAQVGRLVYMLAHGVKEGIVAGAREWTGFHSAHSLITGEPLEGYWLDRTAYSKARDAARRRGKKVEDVSIDDFKIPMTLELEPLPCWQDRPEEAWRADIAEIVERIENDAARERERTGRDVVGMSAAAVELRGRTPARRKKSRAPDFHAFSQAIRRRMRNDLREFMRAYREASTRLRSGELGAAKLFPQGCFPPGLPFVPIRA